MPPAGSFAPLRYAPFRFLLAGRVVSMTGNAVAPIALAFAVLDLTGSALDLGIVVGGRSITTIAFILIGGVVADRLPRSVVMVASSVLAAASQADRGRATFGRGVWGLVLAADTAGAVLGALVAMRLRVRRLLLLGIVCCAAPPLLLVALALTPVAVVLLPAAFLTGLAIEQFGIAWEVSIQEHIPTEKLARVYSYDALGSLLGIPVGQILAGPLAVAFGAAPALLLAAGVGGLAVIGMLASRSVRTLSHQRALPVPVPA
jgi:hypothetical protein